MGCALYYIGLIAMLVFVLMVCVSAMVGAIANGVNTVSISAPTWGDVLRWIGCVAGGAFLVWGGERVCARIGADAGDAIDRALAK